MNSPGKKASWKRILKITGIAIGALLLIAVLAFHILVVWTFKGSRDSETDKNLFAVLENLTVLPSPSAEWERIDLGIISMRLPIRYLVSFDQFADASMLSIKFRDFSIFISGIVQTGFSKKMQERAKHLRPPGSFDYWVEAASSTPDDISYFQWPWANLDKIAFFVWKAGARDITVFRHNTKGLLHRYGTRENLNHYSCKIFSLSEHVNMELMITVKDKVDKKAVLRVLGGIEISEKAFNKSDYIADVKKLEEKYGKKREKEEEKTDSVLFSIRQKNSTISIKKTADGPRYTVTRHDGGVIMENAAKEEFKARFPQEYNDVFDPLGSIDL